MSEGSEGKHLPGLGLGEVLVDHTGTLFIRGYGAAVAMGLVRLSKRNCSVDNLSTSRSVSV